jgi:hypothetical protein
MAGTAFSQSVVGSPHDLSSASGAGNAYHSTNQDQVCIFCHTPHHASTTQTPLWNRSAVTTTYETYWSPTINAYTQVGTPDVNGSSLLCLSCHDGVAALNSLLYLGSVGTIAMAGDSTHITTLAMLAGTPGLTNDHPVSFDYGDAITGGDTELVAEASLPAWALEDGDMQCASCHDVHDYGSTTAMQPFLNESKTGSAICLTCHVK